MLELLRRPLEEFLRFSTHASGVLGLTPPVLEQHAGGVRTGTASGILPE